MAPGPLLSVSCFHKENEENGEQEADNEVDEEEEEVGDEEEDEEEGDGNFPFLNPPPSAGRPARLNPFAEGCGLPLVTTPSGARLELGSCF